MMVIVLLGSCTTAYKSGQTPDDVYFSPSKNGGEEYLAAKPKEYNRVYRDDAYNDPNDNWLRMRVRNPYLWNRFDYYDMYGPSMYSPSSWMYNWNSPYSFHYGSYFNSFYNWNSFFNPYFTTMVVVTPKLNPLKYANTRYFNTEGYKLTNPVYTRGASLRSSYLRSGSSNYNNSNSYLGSKEGTLGNSLRKVVSGSSSGYSNGNTYTPSSYERPVRSYNPSSGGGLGGGSSSGGFRSGGGVSRPGRGN